MVTAETRTHLIGLSVVMLGSAPGTDLLNEWIEAMDGGATLEDIANHIAASDAFQATYPPLQTNREFAEDMLESLIGSEVVPGVLRAAAADIVVSLLNDGMTRGALALAVVGALSDIAAQGEEHPAYGDLGNVAHAIANKTEVAAHHTIEKRIAEPSSDALAGVTSDAATVEAAIRDIDSPPADAVFDEVGTLSVTENADGSGMPGDDNAPISAGYVTATDSNGDAVSYSIEGDPADWMILENGKLCYVGAGLDHEAGDAVSLNIVATSIGADGAETSVVRNVSVMVGDVQESDAVFADATLAIDENETAGMVGSVTATDAEDDAVTYRLADGSPEGFSIDAETGAVSYAGEGLDHETAATVDLTVIATSIGASNMETDVSRTFTVMVGDVDDLPERKLDPIPLTPTIDNFTGGDNDDTFVAQPVQVADGRFNATLNSFDSIDGGGGNDTIHIFGVDPEALRLGAEDVTNVENVVITTVGDIDADLRDWTGLESVTLDRFGRDDETTVRVIVDGAMVNTDRTFNGDVTIVGANGAVNIEAGSGSDVHVGSEGHTETVMVKGGMSVRVDNGAGGGNKQSMTVTSVSVDGVARDPGEKDPAKPADSSNVREATIPPGNSGFTPSATVVQYVRQATAAEDTADTGGVSTSDGVVAVTAIEAALNTYYVADQAEDNLPEGVTLTNTGMILVTSDITKAEGYVAEVEEGDPTGSEPTLYVDSDSIETVALHNTTAIVAVTNQSKTADEEDMPEDLSVTVNKYGTFQPWGAVKQAGKLCIGGSGSAENI
ncbi:MAG: cadherin repeat domain-containing protein, partial [Gammaproteobacteria bacterium]|nr:cadherin repeat domain-containing protein [Gammaproteobacteria bacterium]